MDDAPGNAGAAWMELVLPFSATVQQLSGGPGCIGIEVVELILPTILPCAPNS
jgi:hypothetical protein